MEVLQDSAKQLGLSLSARHLALFERYYRELSIWNERFNLTAITGYEAVQLRHFVDSLTCLLAFPTPTAQGIPSSVPLLDHIGDLWCVDIGTGAGFPGIPIKILLPEMHLTLIEATGKKVRFLQHITRVLGLHEVEIIRERAEIVAHQMSHRERYDIVLSRAVAHLSPLAEYCLPFCRLGGRMIALKGEEAHQETEEAKRALNILGGKLIAVKALPFFEPVHHLVVIDKIAHTPEAYPRRPGIPAKRPL